MRESGMEAVMRESRFFVAESARVQRDRHGSVPMAGESYMWRNKGSKQWTIVIDFDDRPPGDFDVLSTEFIFLKEVGG